MYAAEHDDWKKNNIGVTFDLHHIPFIADRYLDVTVTPKNIKAGFKAAGIFPFNLHAFTEILLLQNPAEKMSVMLKMMMMRITSAILWLYLEKILKRARMKT